MEPEQLRRGKRFHRRVQADWSGTVEDAPVLIEHGIALQFLPRSAKRVRRGRIDVFIDKIEDFVTVVEIKSTDWDKVKPKNRRKVLGSHRRQVWKYVDEFVDREGVSVCAGVIYPSAPKESGLKGEVETYLNDYGLQVVWFDDD